MESEMIVHNGKLYGPYPQLEDKVCWWHSHPHSIIADWHKISPVEVKTLGYKLTLCLMSSSENILTYTKTSIRFTLRITTNQ